MAHKLVRFTLSFTQKEYEYHTKRASNKKQNIWSLIQQELNKTFASIQDLDDATECSGIKKRKTIDIIIPYSLEKKIICVAKKIGLTPGQLIYRLLLAPHLLKIIEGNSIEHQEEEPQMSPLAGPVEFPDL